MQKSFIRKKYEEQYNQSKGYQYAICLKSDNIPIGYAKINIDESYDLGYGLKRNFGIKALFLKPAKQLYNRQNLMEFHILQLLMILIIRAAVML